MVANETYKGLQIYYYSDWNNEINGFTFAATVFDSTAKNDSDFLFVEKSHISNLAVRVKYNLLTQVAEDEVTQITLAKVKTRIDFGLFERGNVYLQSVTAGNIEEVDLPIEDELIQYYLLKGLYNLRKSNPQAYFTLSFSVVGFCEILKISLDTYVFNASLLIEDGLIETKVNRGIENGHIYINSNGVRVLTERLKKEEIKKVSSTSLSETEDKKYDIAISFAGEDRAVAEKIAIKLSERGVSVFYDNFEESDLWGKNLYDYLSAIYSDKSKYCIMLLSEHYEKKLWTNLERRSAQARAFRENREYILPIRIDDTKITGIQETVGYIDIKSHSTEEIVELVMNKLRKI